VKAVNASLERTANGMAHAAQRNRSALQEAPIVATRRRLTSQQGCVVFAKNKKRVSAFYQLTLGLDVEESDPSHDLLRGNGYEVVVHSIPRKYAATIKIARPAEPRDETPFKPTFVVADLEAVRGAVAKTGGYLKPLERAWHFRGCVVLDGWDPEGNIVQFKQPE
jgi:predicted enzyme related to lactoylglutathione lyase